MCACPENLTSSFKAGSYEGTTTWFQKQIFQSITSMDSGNTGTLWSQDPIQYSQSQQGWRSQRVEPNCIVVNLYFHMNN